MYWLKLMSSLDFCYKGVGGSLGDSHRRDRDECDKRRPRGKVAINKRDRKG